MFPLAMPKHPDVGLSFVKAIEHGHVPVDEDSNAATQVFALSNNAAVRQEQREALEALVTNIDDNVEKVNVFYTAMALNFRTK